MRYPSLLWLFVGTCSRVAFTKVVEAHPSRFSFLLPQLERLWAISLGAINFVLVVVFASYSAALPQGVNIALFVVGVRIVGVRIIGVRATTRARVRTA